MVVSVWLTHIKKSVSCIIITDELKVGLLYGIYTHCTYIFRQSCLIFPRVACGNYFRTIVNVPLK
jgi:hypothetical protein